MKTYIKNISLALTSLLLLTKCEIDKYEYKKVTYNDKANFFDDNSMFIAHKQSLSYFNLKSNEVTDEIFKTINDRPLPGSVHSIGVDTINKIGIITLPEAKTIEFVNSRNLVSEGYIEIREEPKFIEVYDDIKPYELKSHISFVTCGYNPGSLCVINHHTQRILYRLYTGYNPGKMILDKYLYVLNNGGLENDSTIAVIDARENMGFEITDKIVVDYNPFDIVLDDYKIAAVLCEGERTFGTENPELQNHSPASIVVVDLFNKSVLAKYEFKDEQIRPTKLLSFSWTDKTAQLMIDKKLFAVDLENLALPASLIDKPLADVISLNKTFAISDVATSNEAYLYTFDKDNFVLKDSLEINNAPISIIKPLK